MDAVIKIFYDKNYNHSLQTKNLLNKTKQGKNGALLFFCEQG